MYFSQKYQLRFLCVIFAENAGIPTGSCLGLNNKIRVIQRRAYGPGSRSAAAVSPCTANGAGH